MLRLSLFLAAALMAAPAHAHHSFAMFDFAKNQTLSGTVTAWRFTNPHSWLYVNVVGADGKVTEWHFEGGSTSHMARNGWTFKTLKVGDKVTVSFLPRIDGKPEGAFMKVLKDDGSHFANSVGN